LTETSQYASVLAKIGAERGNLLDENKIRTMSEAENLNEFVSRLNETVYADYLSQIMNPVNSRKIEHALKQNQARTLIKIINYSPMKVRGFLSNELRKFEVENIKILLKSVSAGLSTDEKIERIYLLPEEFLKNRHVFEEATEMDNIKNTIESLKKIDHYATALDFGLSRFRETGSMKSFDIFLDKAYFTDLTESLSTLPKREQKHAIFYTKMKVEVFILLAILRAKLLGYDANWLRLTIPKANFSISEKSIEPLITSEDYESALKLILQSPYGTFFEKASEPEETLSNFEKSTEKAIFNHAYNLRFKELFNVEACIIFILQKDTEIRNLVTISLGIENGTKPTEIQSNLLLPETS
jgi:vacuolar-type H+-ATPase subunit C/Vma6